MYSTSWLTTGRVLAVVVILLVAAPVILATPLLVEPHPRRGPEQLPEDFPFLDRPSPESEQSGIASVADVAAWSRLVFQSVRDGNWEIYFADGDGTNQVRITHTSAADMHPSLNRGSTRIVYASNRTGNYEIHSQAPGQQGSARLTFTSQNEYQPAWSPDGSRIAFQSYRDGQSEIYVMDSDGSNQTRLTWDADYDGEPAWSPDGTKLAFTSRRTGGYRIWVMNADGSGKTQLSTQPYSEHPAWSPDGSQIAYDSDGYGDGWWDLWVMNADGSEAHSLVTGMSQTDCISPSWSPDGRYIAYTSVYWIMWEGNWYWRETRLFAWDSQGPRVTLSDNGRDWRPDWQTMDAQPPVTWMSPLPPYSRYWDVPVSWSGADEGAGASGLWSFDVQSREGEGAWTGWMNHTESTLAAYSGTSGQRAAFRVRARDVAYNLSNWTPDARVPETWLYAFELSGATRDVRGIPLAGAEIFIDPEPVTPVAPNSGGGYRAYLSQPGATQASVTAAGQGQLPSSTWEKDHDRSVDFYLPPPEDVVQNGGFEAGGGSLAGWNLGGSFTPTVTYGRGTPERVPPFLETNTHLSWARLRPSGMQMTWRWTASALCMWSTRNGDSPERYVPFMDFVRYRVNGSVPKRRGVWAISAMGLIQSSTSPLG